jgi:HemY protein
MKRTIIFILILLAAAWLGLKIHHDPGYVLIAYHHTSVETTLWFALAACVLVTFLLLLIGLSGCRLFTMPQRLSQWLKRRSQHIAHADTLRGIELFMDGQWQQAEKLLVHAHKHSQHPLLNLLFAAKAASRHGHTTQRDDYLKSASDQAPDARFTVSLTQAQLQIEHQQHEQALATLQQLHQQQPQHLWICQQLAELYWSLKDWSALMQLIPTLKKHRHIDHETLIDREIHAHTHLIQQANTLDALHTYLNKCSKEAKKSPRFITAHCQQLIALGQHHDASKKLKKLLQKQWHEETLTTLEPLCELSPKDTLNTLLPWAKKHPQSALLHYLIGQCYLKQKLHGQAKNHFNLSTQANHHFLKSWHALALIAENARDYQQALKCLKQAHTNTQ